MQSFKTLWALGVCLGFASCAKTNNPAQPSASTPAAETAATASVTVPRPLAPAVDAFVRHVDQPVTLVVANAIITQSAAPTYTFEVASDVGFATKAYSKSGVAQGTNGQTSLTIDRIAAGADYYWRARAEGGGTSGPFTAPRKFTIGPAIVIAAPALVSPAANAATPGRPTLTVSNATRTGPAGSITYRFEIAATSTFSPVLVAATIPEGAGRTTFTPSSDLSANATYFWRVTALDAANGVASPASAVGTFVTSLAIDLSKVIVSYPGAPNPASWPQTATITAVEQDGNPSTGGVMCISFSVSREWPSIAFLGDADVQIYANQWYFANIGGQWYGGPAEYLRVGRGFCKAGQGTNTIGPDGGWTEPMRSWAPKVGELVGYMMTTPARAGHRSIDERSDIVVQPWRDSSRGSSLAPAARR